ncbi:13899_t:CDS:2 [Ambispora leptoticha]|uniref:13899_t:CDS:1 n=1 Tax=Ambispora leptoticha TaxID=144679 RepID=A0A9N8YVK8_9GLOM|nr:13899_t:CDS:2 [Ambispora leptoticha]
MATAFLKANPTLIPLFLACGGGVGGSIMYAFYTLRTNPDVIVNKVGNPQPWNRIAQHENAKLITINKQFFEDRKGMESPSSRY